MWTKGYHWYGWNMKLYADTKYGIIQALRDHSPQYHKPLYRNSGMWHKNIQIMLFRHVWYCSIIFCSERYVVCFENDLRAIFPIFVHWAFERLYRSLWLTQKCTIDFCGVQLFLLVLNATVVYQNHLWTRAWLNNHIPSFVWMYYVLRIHI